MDTKEVKNFTEFLEKIKALFEEYNIEGFVWAKQNEQDISAVLSEISNVDDCVKSFGLNLIQLHKKYFSNDLPENFVNVLQVVILGTDSCMQFLLDKQQELSKRVNKSMLN